ncbi:MAG: energy-coupling factor transporter ATPase [Clostridia bacterium]|nr:energy-coupling factor transporter ATPase [Clostridia bacterium]
MQEHFIELKDVSFSYDEVKAVDHLSIDVGKGQFVGLLGRNGSGKSTAARLINSLLVPDEGTVVVDGITADNDELVWQVRTKVGMVFQNPDNQIIGTSVEEDTAFGPENLGIERPEMVKRVDFALKTAGLDEYRTVEPHHLSGGQKQRLAIAGVLAMQPECIILDEATAMLDPIGRSEVMSVIKKLNKEKGITIIHITHHMDEVTECDKVYIIDKGTVAAEGKPEEIFSAEDGLKSHGLDVPQVTQLFNELQRRGIELPDGIITVEKAAEVIGAKIREKISG